MAFHTGKPAYRSTPSSAEVRESLAYLKALTDLLENSGVKEADLAALHNSGASSADLAYGYVPVGGIIAYIPGYFTDSSNGGFTYKIVTANTIAAVNTALNSKGWYVCDGSALNDADSGIFNGVGRYLPNLTDDRFLMGDTVAGGIGGANSNNISHVHSTGNFTLLAAHIPAHTHTITVNSAGAHVHTWDGPTGTAGAVSHNGSSGMQRHIANSRNTSEAGAHTHTASASSIGGGTAHNHGNTGSSGSNSLENRPKYLSCFYIMRVK